MREVWRFYDSFMEPLALHKVKFRRCSGGEVTFSHSTNQAEKRQQVPRQEGEIQAAMFEQR